jgi:hypothetical protein
MDLKCAETHATYTYPAHHSFFIGLIPRFKNSSDKYLNTYKQIWRSSSANKTSKEIAITFDEPTIIDYYKHKDYQTIGFGGVPFFDLNNKNNTLPKLFEEFIYFGPKEKIPRLERIPRSPNWYPLNNIEYIVSSIKKDSYFLFINSIATHIPYDNPEHNITAKEKEILTKIYSAHDLKNSPINGVTALTTAEVSHAIEMQRDSLLWADKQIKKLLESLKIKKETILIVCADHGEEFGENGRFGHAHVDDTVMHVPYWDTILNRKSL